MITLAKRLLIIGGDYNTCRSADRVGALAALLEKLRLWDCLLTPDFERYHPN